jgi:two-component system response regulator TtrR
MRRTGCDVLVTDVRMPDMDGLELLEKTRTFRPHIAVLIVTGYGDIPMAVKAVKAGAEEFIEKPLAEETFVPMIEEALERSISRFKPDIKILTKTEIVILKLVGEGKTNKEIADGLGRSVRTVENHRHRLMRKLGSRNAVDLIKKAINLGLASSDEA